MSIQRPEAIRSVIPERKGLHPLESPASSQAHEGVSGQCNDGPSGSHVNPGVGGHDQHNDEASGAPEAARGASEGAAVDLPQ